MPRAATADLFSLSIPERIQLVEDIWDSITVHPEMVKLSPEIKTELDKRLAEFEQHPDESAPWDEVRTRLWKML